MVDSTKNYSIQFKDEEIFKVSPNFVKLSKTWTNMLEDIHCEEEDGQILLPCSENFSNQSYIELYNAYNILISKEADYFTKLEQNQYYNSPDNRILTETENELKYTPEQYPLLFEMISAANFLDMNTFIQLLSKMIAHKINEARLSDSDQDIHNLLGNPEVELSAEQQQLYDQKVEVLESLKKNEAVSM